MRIAIFLFPVAVAACGGILTGGSDGGSDASPPATTCTTSADCPNGGDCAYPDTGGCSAHKQCFPPKQQCKGQFLCACDGTSLGDDCNGGASKPIAHAGLCDGPPGCGDALACETCDVTGFTPTQLSPPVSATNACSPSDIQAFVTACVGSTATPTTCSGWQESDAGAACGACILTPTTSAQSGALLCDATSCQANEGGCVDILLSEVSREIGSGGSGSCGDLVSAEYGCIDYACGACTTSSDFDACETNATQVECQAYADAVKSSSACATDVDTSVCLPQSDRGWARFINVFCGTGP